MTKEIKLPNFSTGTKVFLRALSAVDEEGNIVKKELGFMQLRRCYFGLGRAQDKATTSFYNQVQNQLKKEVIVKTPEGKYALGKIGIELREKAKEEQIDLNVKSEAQQKWELTHPEATEEQKAIVS